MSWLEHLRQHERSTLADRDIQQQALAFHIGEMPPVVSHFLAHPIQGRIDARPDSLGAASRQVPFSHFAANTSAVTGRPK
ncbi:MAG: MFS transporter [Rhodospirillales bacterium]